MTRRDLFFLSLKGLLAWLVLSCLVWYFKEQLINGLLPLIKAVAILISPDLSPSFKLVKSAHSSLDYSIELTAWVLHPIYLNASHSIPAKTELKSIADLLHVMVPLVIEGSILLVWPVQRWPQRGLLLALGMPTAVLVVMATLPTQLLGNLELSFQDIASAGEILRPIPWFVDWMVFCELGGRWLLGIAASWICIQLQSKISSVSRINRPSSSR